MSSGPRVCSSNLECVLFAQDNALWERARSTPPGKALANALAFLRRARSTGLNTALQKARRYGLRSAGPVCNKHVSATATAKESKEDEARARPSAQGGRAARCRAGPRDHARRCVTAAWPETSGADLRCRRLPGFRVYLDFSKVWRESTKEHLFAQTIVFAGRPALRQPNYG